MATYTWKGSAPAIAGVKAWKFTTAGTIGDIISVTIGSKTVTYATTSATIATFLPLLVTYLAALDSAVYPEFAEITWSSTSPNLIATDDTAGKPSIVTVSTNSGTTTINSGAVTDATNATPIVITSASHGLSTGTKVTIASVGGNTAANGTWIIDVVTANTFSLRTSVGNGAYTAGGTWTAPTGNTTTVSSGPYSLSTAANYSGGTLPVTGDSLTIDLEGTQILYDLETQSAVVLAARRITAQTVTIGLPITNPGGYTEYRATHWQQTATTDYVNTSSQRIKLDHLTGQTLYEQGSSGSGQEQGVGAVSLKGSHASNVVNVFGGQLSGDALTAATLRLDAGATVLCGNTCTLGTVNNYGGTLTVNSAIGTALNHPSTAGAKTTIEGSGAVASLQMQGGTVYYNTTGALGGNTVLANSAALIFDDDQQAKTVTNAISIYSPSVRVVDSNGCVTAGFDFRAINCKWIPTGLRSNSKFVTTLL